MIVKFRNSLFGKGTSIGMVFVMLLNAFPLNSTFALTGGPTQPEFSSFTPIGTSDMVDLVSGDFSYNLPLMDVGGFPLNLAYSSGINMDQEASWVGLGWNLSVGQINRQMRGLPDDFNGQQVTYEDDIKDNYTIGTNLNANLAAFGVTAVPDFLPDPNNINFGLSVQYNSYSGVTATPSSGISYDIANSASIGLNVASSPDGLNVSPSVSLHGGYKAKKGREVNLGSSFGVSMNSRQGLSAINVSASSTPNTFKGMTKIKKQDNEIQGGRPSIGSAVSFVDNVYTPTVRPNLMSVNFTFNAALGSQFFGGEGQGQIGAYGSNQFIPEQLKKRNVTVYGYDHTHNAHENALLDFNREKDGNFSNNSTNLPLTNYTYDLYSVQGQGVSGMFRPYRSQVGYIHDNLQGSLGFGGSGGVELGVGSAAHVGVDVEVNTTISHSGEWNEGNNALETFQSDQGNNELYEEVFYKNVGDLSVDKEFHIYGDEYQKLGGYQPAQLAIEGTEYNRNLSNTYNIKSSVGTSGYNSNSAPLNEQEIKRTQRLNRNQAILKVSMKDAELAENNNEPLLGFNLNTSVNVGPESTAGFVVTRNDGARYVYGEALYNTLKREVTFAIGEPLTGEGDAPVADCATGLVSYSPGVDNSIDNQKGDQYFNRVSTPAYAHTFLLTTLLSTDYSDITGDGPSVDDYGSYTLFEYRTPTTSSQYKWRVPLQENTASYNEGLKADPTDDKGSYVYGEKENKFIQKIETKTHVAIFTISERHDGHGANGEDGGVDNTMDMYKLDKISLYSRGEFYDENGAVVGGSTDGLGNISTSATPIKEVHFEYDYSLCPKVPNNDGIDTPENADQGKLTLKKLYFTYRNSNMGKYTPYVFTYGDSDHDGVISNSEKELRNPDYNLKAYDFWGNYKPNSDASNCDKMDYITAPEFSYVEQDNANTDDYAAAWSLTDIKVHTGGKIQVDYEADDYAFVQDKKAMRMFKVIGAGEDPLPQSSEMGTFDESGGSGISQSNTEALLYKTDNNNEEAEYLYIKLSEQDQSLIPSNMTQADMKDHLFDYYLKDIIQNQKSLIQYRFFINTTPKGGKNNNWQNGDFDYVSGYFELGNINNSQIFSQGGEIMASIPMKKVLKHEDSGQFVNPISKSAWNFSRKYLSRYVYNAPNIDPNNGPEVVVQTLIAAADNIVESFSDPNTLLRSKEIGRRFIPEKSWIRLGEPSGFKKGGGSRVKRIVMTDEWAQMNSDFSAVVQNDVRNQKYGQEYSYVQTDESGNSFSSGVATYEPIGAKDNPFVQPVFVNTQRLLAPDEENYVEKPFGESFFPSPTVTYSKVEVKNLEREDNGKVVKSNATGSVITEFYTSKDFPTICDQTEVQLYEDDPGFLNNLLNLHVKKHLTLSQGYSIHLNDMNGKMKSQRVFAEGQEEPISGVDYKYRLSQVGNVSGNQKLSSNGGLLNNNLPVLYPNGSLKNETVGVEIDVINDFREMTSSTEVVGTNGNVASFLIGVLPVVVPVPIPDYALHEDKLNMAITTKIVNTFGILEETIAHDAGASVSTKNILWDSETGEVLLTETVNEYQDHYYSFNYPAHWHYKGMGMAFKNLGASAFFSNGTGYFNILSGSNTASNILFPGDVVLYEDDDEAGLAWVNSVNGNTFELIDRNGGQVSLSSSGNNYNKLTVMRSGRRNLQSTSMGSVVTQTNPLIEIQNSSNFVPSDFLNKQSGTPGALIVNAGAVEFAENWDPQCECNNTLAEGQNEYVINKKGVWRASKSWLYLTGRNGEDNPNPRKDGFYSEFTPFYKKSGSNWVKDDANWQFTSEVTSFSPYGFELENKDALDRRSAAQYGYNFSFPLAVGANTGYNQMGYDGFEDYNFNGCPTNEHFGFRDVINPQTDISNQHSHTGRHSLIINAGSTVTKIYHIDCNTAQP